MIIITVLHIEQLNAGSPWKNNEIPVIDDRTQWSASIVWLSEYKILVLRDYR